VAARELGCLPKVEGCAMYPPGPGVPTPENCDFSCLVEMKILLALSRVPPPKEKAAVFFRLLSGWGPTLCPTPYDPAPGVSLARRT